MEAPGDDAADAARAAAGDLASFDRIVARWQDRLVGLAWRFSRDRTAAEDMAQEALVKAFRSIASFRGEAKFSTWLTAVALNTYRSRLRREGPPLLGLDAVKAFGSLPGAQDQLEDEERAEAVRRAVVALPARYRDAIIVYYFHERDLAESARVLGVSEGTLKAHLHRGRGLLRRRCAHLGLAPAREKERA